MSKTILFTFAGNTDPIRSYHDGPILHICRYYRPEKIYLMLTEEMAQRDKEGETKDMGNIYERSLYANLPGYRPDIVRIFTGIREAHLFDIYNEWIHKTFKQIKEENPDVEKVYVNVTSGTPQSTLNLAIYAVNNIEDLPLCPIQVSSPEKKSNEEPPVNITFDVQANAEANFDNDPTKPTRRLEPANLTYYTRVLLKQQILKLLDNYHYESASLLMRQGLFTNYREIVTLLNYANDRKHLKGLESNSKLRALKNPNYDTLYYYTKDAKAAKVEYWYEILDYFALACAKAKAKDITGYVLMVEPLAVNIYLSVLRDLIRIHPDKLFDSEKISGSYKINVNKLDRDLKKHLDDKFLNPITNSYVSDKVLIHTIQYYLEKKSMLELSKDFDRLYQALDKVKPIRNKLAHSLHTITEKDFESAAKIRISELNELIRSFSKKYYKGYRDAYVDFYDNINEEIRLLLQKEV